MKVARRGDGVRHVSLPPPLAVAGMYRVVADERAVGCTLVPGVAGLDQVAFVGEEPNEVDASALDRVTDGLGAHTTWRQWAAASPVVASIKQSLEPSAVVLALEADLGSLQAVCRAPRMLLRHDEAREPVSRARRLSPKTAADLVARPADWEHRTLRGIRPARVLSLVVEDEVDLYENRVTARLLDRLDAHLTQRLQELTSVCQMLAEGHDFSDETRGSHWRAKRLERVWERVEHDDVQRERAAALRRRVIRLRDAVRALYHAPLYQGVPRGARVDDALRATNIFVNDRAYRRVAALWRVVVAARASAPSRRDALQRRLRLSERFDSFATLLTIQALANLGYTPRDPAQTLTQRLDLVGPRGELTLERLPDGTITLRGEGVALNVVGLPVRVTADAARLCDALRGVQAHETLFLLFGRPDDVERVDSEGGADRRMLAGWSSPRALVVSPWSLDATERVARVLGVWDAGARLARFPLRIPWRGGVPEVAPAWVGQCRGALALIRPPTPGERRATVAALRARLDDAGSKVSPRGEQQRRDEQQLLALIERAEGWQWLARCPVCAREGARFEDRWQTSQPPERQTVWCRCVGCDAAWGLHACGACGGRYAVLNPGVSLACPDDVTQLDRTYGRDLWCEPNARTGMRAGRCVQCAQG